MLMSQPIQKSDSINGLAVDLGHFPALISLSTDVELEGDVHEVDDVVLKSLDNYEGVGLGLYRREVTTTKHGHEVVVYVFNRFIRSWNYNDNNPMPEVKFYE